MRRWGAYEGLPTVTAPVRNVWSGNMAVRTDAFRKLGGFRTYFGKCRSTSQPEDTDLCMRMAAATGGPWMYVPTAAVNHIVSRSHARRWASSYLGASPKVVAKRS
jgi:GT2 family glycosyltransferase